MHILPVFVSSICITEMDYAPGDYAPVQIVEGG